MTKQCVQCSKTFQITDSDQAFYDKLKVPAPTLCPDCRQQRRFAWRNERFFYSRKCDLTGKPIISVYSPNGPIKKVYDTSVWFSDQWNALDYGRDFDFSRTFFEQFNALMCDVPHLALWAFENDNADYNHCSTQLKNSYMNSSTDKSEDSYYSYLCVNNTSVVDCTSVEHSELAIECVDCDHLYNCTYCQLCRNCMNTYLSYDCSGCKNVFGCSGLRNKEYYLFNKQVSPEEWEKIVPELLASFTKLQSSLTKAYDTSLTHPRLFTSIFNSQNSTGNYLWNSNNCTLSYDCREGENLKYMVYAPWRMRDSMDCYAIADGELLYDANFGPGAYNTQFAMWLKNGPRDSQYCVYCVNNCENIFACVGLKNKKYCIFNKQYSKESFDKLRTKIIEHMKVTGEYGEFFPAKYSPFGYNETIAQEYYPLNKTDVQRFEWNWQEDTGGTFGKETIKLDTMPDSIQQTQNPISKEILVCSTCQKNYQIIPQELQLYRQLGLALPRECMNCRHLRRIHLRNPRQLWQRQCMCTQVDHQHQGRCATEFETTYSPERKEIIYCEQCYQKEIY